MPSDVILSKVVNSLVDDAEVELGTVPAHAAGVLTVRGPDVLTGRAVGRLVQPPCGFAWLATVRA